MNFNMFAIAESTNVKIKIRPVLWLVPNNNASNNNHNNHNQLLRWIWRLALHVFSSAWMWWKRLRMRTSESEVPTKNVLYIPDREVRFLDVSGSKNKRTSCSDFFQDTKVRDSFLVRLMPVVLFFRMLPTPARLEKSSHTHLSRRLQQATEMDHLGISGRLPSVS